MGVGFLLFRFGRATLRSPVDALSEVAERFNFCTQCKAADESGQACPLFHKVLAVAHGDGW
jgi:hypothetical protein